MIQDIIYLAAGLIAAAMVWLATGLLDDWLDRRYARKHRERYWRDMDERMAYWAKSDTEYSRSQRRMRGEE